MLDSAIYIGNTIIQPPPAPTVALRQLLVVKKIIPTSLMNPNRGGGTCIFSGYHPRKSTFKTNPKHVFPSMKIYSNYAFLHVFLLIFPSCHFPNL